MQGKSFPNYGNFMRNEEEKKVRLNSALLLLQLATLQENEPLFLPGPMLLIKIVRNQTKPKEAKPASFSSKGPSTPSFFQLAVGALVIQVAKGKSVQSLVMQE